LNITTERPSNKLQRLGLIGPVLPYRGGVAQYTTMLHRTLTSKSELLTFSFKRQYPKFLYPGTSQLDPRYKDHSEPGVHYVLDPMNPFTWRKACHLLTEYVPHSVIISWWTIFFLPCFGYIAQYLRKRGVQIIFLCHNVFDHEYASWKAGLTRLILSQGNAFLVHAKEEADRLKSIVKGARIVMHPHPIFCQFPRPVRRLPRRSRLELLFFGFVRPYKGLDVLLKAMHFLKEEDVFLTIAGEWWSKNPLLKELADNEYLKNKVEIIDRYVSEQETAEYFSRADIVILPYRSATGTGIIPLAYYYGKPVIATKVGGFTDVVEDNISGRLVKPEDPYALAGAIREFLNTSPAHMQEGVRRVSASMTWESLSKHILDSVNGASE
jgi:glycosyltransferase involved in cell wall biosynthesis